MPQAEIDEVIVAGIAFRTSGCPGKFRDDVSACDRPYGDSPPRNIASYPFQPNSRTCGRSAASSRSPSCRADTP